MLKETNVVASPGGIIGYGGSPVLDSVNNLACFLVVSQNATHEGNTYLIECVDFDTLESAFAGGAVPLAATVAQVAGGPYDADGDDGPYVRLALTKAGLAVAFHVRKSGDATRIAAVALFQGKSIIASVV